MSLQARFLGCNLDDRNDSLFKFERFAILMTEITTLRYTKIRQRHDMDAAAQGIIRAPPLYSMPTNVAYIYIYS